jgi:hypothetical protein
MQNADQMQEKLKWPNCNLEIKMIAALKLNCPKHLETFRFSIEKTFQKAVKPKIKK